MCFAASNRQKEASSSSSESFFLSFFLLCATATLRISHINARVLSWYNSRTADEHALKNHISEIFTQIRKQEFWLH
jgi:hypothetical protein